MNKETALLVIDVQVGMFHEVSPVYEGDALLTTIEKMIDRARANDVPIIYIQHNEGPGKQLETSTPNWEIHPTISPRADEVVIQKHTPDSFHQTNLQRELESRGIKKLILTGIQTDACVDTTCRRAFSMGYDVTLVQDGHSTWPLNSLSATQIIEHHNTILGWFADVRESNAILAIL